MDDSTEREVALFLLGGSSPSEFFGGRPGAFMLQRYKMYRGTRPADDPLPVGNRMDTRRHTKHCLRPPKELVDAYLGDPTKASWAHFARTYRSVLTERLKQDPTPFEELAELATNQDVSIGCSCPTKQNPDVRHCHTVLALEFMKKSFPELRVMMPEP